MDDDAVAILKTCSNWGRWGEDDQLGTLNLITPDVIRAASRLVIAGRSVSLSKPISTVQSLTNPRPAWHVMELANHDYSTSDSLHIGLHGHATTHIDALGHIFWEGAGYNGLRQADIVTTKGLTALDVDVMKDGIVTRGVYLDVAAAAGVEYLAATHTVTADLLETAEALAGEVVGSGDAVVVNTGLHKRIAVDGPEDPSMRCGLDIGAVRWLRDRDVSLYSGDCIEQLPLTPGRVEMPLHQIGLASMGLAILDCVAVDELERTCGELGRSSFLLMIGPLRIPGASGAPVNPLAVF